MNQQRRTKVGEALKLAQSALELVTDVAQEEREAFDNLNEGLKAAESGQKLESNADTLDSAQSSLEEAIASLEEIE